MEKENQTMKKRILALLLSLLMAGVPALAAETDVPVPDAGEEVSAPAPAPGESDSAPAPEPDTADPEAAIGAAANPFTDVKDDSPFLPGILYAVARGITNGTSATTFSPYVICTHAQILTFLWRGWGSPEPGIENPFPDIKPEAYYYKAALWSYEQGLTDASFAPYAYCTRLQAVTYLWKLAGAPSAQESGLPFTDIPDDPDARNAVAWASMEQSITNGTTETTFSPAKRCTRAQIVTFIYRGRDLFRNQGADA